ncbi:MAG: hypothetical protein ACLQQB_10380 [Solirubrobacteraceae bacterium]|jgi:hypothetical protein
MARHHGYSPWRMRVSRLPIRAPSALCALVLLAALTALALPAGTLGRGLLGVGSIAVSPDGRFVYSAAFASSAVGIFRRVTNTVSRG